jgi:hypothetical protein
MKAVVVDERGSRAVLLTESGSFERVESKNYRVGQKVSWTVKRRLPLRRWLVAACVLAVLMGGAGALAASLPFAYVSLDINPSLEYTLNWFDRVLSVRAVNNDAQSIAQSLVEEGVLGQPIDSAIGMTLSELRQSQYVSADAENDVVLAVASLGIKNVDSLTKRVADSARDDARWSAITVTTLQADYESVERSREYQTTAGKLLLVESLETLQGNPPDFSKEEWLQKPVRDILERKEEIQQSSGASPSAPGDSGGPESAPSPKPSAGHSAPDTGAPPQESAGGGPSAGAASTSPPAAPKATPSPQSTAAARDTPSPQPPASAPQHTSAPTAAQTAGDALSPSSPQHDGGGDPPHSSPGDHDQQGSSPQEPPRDP